MVMFKTDGSHSMDTFFDAYPFDEDGPGRRSLSASPAAAAAADEWVLAGRRQRVAGGEPQGVDAAPRHRVRRDAARRPQQQQVAMGGTSHYVLTFIGICSVTATIVYIFEHVPMEVGT
jgi:hypothetical protein